MQQIRLTRGLTHYELTGPENGPLIVLLHGSTIPAWVWDCQVPALVAAGYRVLRYDQYGKGRSQSPRAIYNRTLYIQQLHDLLNALNLTEPFHLAGFSFGGAFAAQFCLQYPERVRKLILIAPVLNMASRNKLLKYIRMPIVGPLFLGKVVLPRLTDRAAGLWAGSPQSEAYRQQFQSHLQTEGFLRAFRSFLTNNALTDYSETYKALGLEGKTALLIWGNKDQDIPGEDMARIRQWMPGTDYLEIDGIGHGTVLQSPTLVNDKMLAYLAS
ncbi:alpha/beta fold hydrolase [Limnobacter litoralis]|uniref:Alpha/beta hydrolase n=1 Tax=Limnobacter litoralis TaxID=481366 RepID=A0ABQ5YMF9_9BURK|nr:alpha/beta hydrolase [Limnobacter litoralis]GLR25111.1 alpha/beta hydrolase [Limnobacter litoralis]